MRHFVVGERPTEPFRFCSVVRPSEGWRGLPVGPVDHYVVGVVIGVEGVPVSSVSGLVEGVHPLDVGCREKPSRTAHARQGHVGHRLHFVGRGHLEHPFLRCWLPAATVRFPPSSKHQSIDYQDKHSMVNSAG